MHEPAACGARPAQQANVQTLPAETEAIGTSAEKNPAASSSAIAVPHTRRTLECPGDREFIFRTRAFYHRRGREPSSHAKSSHCRMLLLQIMNSPVTSESDARTSVIDPVCGMTVDQQRAAGSLEYHGQTYVFRSLGRCERF